jgi:hypothetical protein
VFGDTNGTITAGNGHNEVVVAPGSVWTLGNGKHVFAFDAAFDQNTITNFNSLVTCKFRPCGDCELCGIADTKQVGPVPLSAIGLQALKCSMIRCRIC